MTVINQAKQIIKKMVISFIVIFVLLTALAFIFLGSDDKDEKQANIKQVSVNNSSKKIDINNDKKVAKPTKKVAKPTKKVNKSNYRDVTALIQPKDLFKCSSKHGYYYVAHLDTSEPIADFLYVKNGQKDSRKSSFYNWFGTRLNVTDTFFGYPSYRTQGKGTYVTSLDRVSGKLRITSTSKNPLYKPNVKGSRKYWTFNDVYNCVKSNDKEKFLNLKKDYFEYKKQAELQKSIQKKKDKESLLKSRKF